MPSVPFWIRVTSTFPLTTTLSKFLGAEILTGCFSVAITVVEKIEALKTTAAIKDFARVEIEVFIMFLFIVLYNNL
ncbi:hypothetical protein D3C72_1871260 [compost metagenome]